MEAYWNIDKKMYHRIWDYEVITPFFTADVAYEHYGFRYTNEIQLLKDKMVIFPHDVFSHYPNTANENSYAHHACHGSWRI